MRKNTGHILRISGLLIEMLGIWGAMSVTGQKDQARVELPGGTIIPLAWIAIGFGFVLWLTGTIVVQMARPRRNPVRKDQSELPL
jgi:hypothetical protein